MCLSQVKLLHALPCSWLQTLSQPCTSKMRHLHTSTPTRWSASVPGAPSAQALRVTPAHGPILSHILHTPTPIRWSVSVPSATCFHPPHALQCSRPHTPANFHTFTRTRWSDDVACIPPLHDLPCARHPDTLTHPSPPYSCTLSHIPTLPHPPDGQRLFQVQLVRQVIEQQR